MKMKQMRTSLTIFSQESEKWTFPSDQFLSYCQYVFDFSARFENFLLELKHNHSEDYSDEHVAEEHEESHGFTLVSLHWDYVRNEMVLTLFFIVIGLFKLGRLFQKRDCFMWVCSQLAPFPIVSSYRDESENVRRGCQIFELFFEGSNNQW